MDKPLGEIRFVDLRPNDHTSFDIRLLSSYLYPVVSYESPHRHNFQELIWVRSGSGSHVVDDQILEIQPHTFYLIAKGQVHRFLEGRDHGLLVQPGYTVDPRFPGIVPGAKSEKTDERGFYQRPNSSPGDGIGPLGGVAVHDHFDGGFLADTGPAGG